ncbi:MULTISPECIES: HD-GYP domain-containing protein [Anoxybacillus]|uniref:HD-GYP domain-containing protein n=1 Tax=Anoxybacillus flavithermus TaxID=33934 RepID=A0A178T7N9_9BACL|nr:HD-GYP domain-containing protein [Anoxybacillus flavithermus]ASA96916.1 HD-GYP domain-containing protein [Anoxybacillus flavithermus]ELK20980.1 c-di-GMP phosphodiesterase class II [Anoxybacillus flavithermus TNO-09.006]MBE2906175.1 HD-GYP domain-containing protein [Anoxybacillus flavithermus]MBE2919602.1 HD-GYP domain-containing protein [Anoxybacillus flavithermus]MBE2923386.1 HD-GYP domain-containing protein [Anoxybacillus flavithermus]
MRKVYIFEAKSGDVLAVDIYGPNGAVLLAKGVKLTDSYIRRLLEDGIRYIYIHDIFTFDIEEKPMISPIVRQQAVKKVYETMTELIEGQKAAQRVSSLDLGQEYQKIFKEILDYLLSRENLLINLSDLVISKGYFFHHSVNVATIAGVIGLAKGYSSQQLLDLGVGAFLFDIGMTQIPSALLGKKGPLSPEERRIVSHHTELGFELLKKQNNVSPSSAYCALQHHERFDGSGYPHQAAGKYIHEFARIIAIADVFDALTSPRDHRKQHSPHEAAEYLCAAGNTLFDYELIKTFLKYVAIYPLGTNIVLNTGYRGVVSNIFPEYPLRPVVRILQNPNGEVLKSPFEIDLRKEVNVTIVEAF